MDAFLVENPPVAMVPNEWQKASKTDIPPKTSKIVSAKVETHQGDDSTTYSVEISYEYEFKGRSCHSDQYAFTKFSSGGRRGKEKVVSYYKNAANPVCFVNPENPSEAVLKRGFHPGLLFALFPVPFLAIGIGGLICMFFGKAGKRRNKDTAAWLGEADVDDDAGEGDARVRGYGMVAMKGKSPWINLLGIFIFSAFWNGIVSVFVFQAIDGWRSGESPWGLTLFISIFVLIGIGTIFGVIYCILALFNPRAKILLSKAEIPIGGMTQLRWEFTGRISMLEKVRFILRGIEKATYRQGTNTRTDKSTFFEMEIYSTDNRQEMAYGDVGFAIPDDTMHSFEADNNKIDWELAVEGEIKRWPDVKNSFEITVLPK